MKKANVDMLSGPITRGLLSMSVPIMIMNVMQSLFNIIDMTVLGKFADDTAVGACGTLISLCTGLLIGISAGANIVVAKRIGEGESERVEKSVGTAVLLARGKPCTSHYRRYLCRGLFKAYKLSRESAT